MKKRSQRLTAGGGNATDKTKSSALARPFLSLASQAPTAEAIIEVEQAGPAISEDQSPRPVSPAAPLAVGADGAPKWAQLVTEYCPVPPKSLKRREKNARYMDPIEFKRLVENVRTDGKLTSMPLVYQHDDGTLELLSGHHRTEAAIAAELAVIFVEVITTRCDEARLTAIQLSHNAIAGKDNPGLLAELYASLDLEAKKFSGLTDNVLQDLVRLDLSALASTTIKYQELHLSFLPDDMEVFRSELERFTQKAKKNQPERWVARLADFDRVFDAVVKTKHETGIVNAAMAILAMAELATERLDQMEATRAEDERARELPKP